MKVKVLRKTYDYEPGAVVDMPRSQAFAWVKAGLAEFVRARPAPQNKAKAKPTNKARKTKKSEE